MESFCFDQSEGRGTSQVGDGGRDKVEEVGPVGVCGKEKGRERVMDGWA